MQSIRDEEVLHGCCISIDIIRFGGVNRGGCHLRIRRLAESALASARGTTRSRSFAKGGAVQGFIIAASKAYGEALVSSEPQIQDIVALYAMMSRMRVVSSSRTIDCADDIMRTTIKTYFAPNKTIRDVNDTIKTGTELDPLKKFSEVVREELRLLASL